MDVLAGLWYYIEGGVGGLALPRCTLPKRKDEPPEFSSRCEVRGVVL